MRFLLIVSCLSATLLASKWADLRRPTPLVSPLEDVEKQGIDWTMIGQQELPGNLFDKLRPTSYLSRIYRNQNHDLGLFIAYYAQQRAGEAMHSPKVCLPGTGWEIVQRGSDTLSVEGLPVVVNQYHAQNAGTNILVLYWYQSRRRITANEYLGKLFLIRDALFEGDTSAALVRIMLPDEPQSATEATRFAEWLIPQVQRCFGNRFESRAQSAAAGFRNPVSEE
jgi:EpsI family protein